MAKESEIQWTDATVNFWTGCQKISQGCKFCYMYRDKERYGQNPQTVLRTADKTFYAALNWKEPKLIFTCSWSDFFIEEADEWRADAWEVIRKTPHHIWQILTKRPERIKKCLPADWGEGWPNVWLGVSAENQKTFDQRVPILAQIPTHVRFLSAEPLLEPIGDFTKAFKDKTPMIDWIIVGGESGNETGKWRYRRCELTWIYAIIYKAEYFHIPVFVKQFGTHIAKKLKLADRHGGNWQQWPEAYKIREMPKAYTKPEFAEQTKLF